MQSQYTVYAVKTYLCQIWSLFFLCGLLILDFSILQRCCQTFYEDKTSVSSNLLRTRLIQSKQEKKCVTNTEHHVQALLNDFY